MKNENNQQYGFSLVETLAIIVILTIVLLLSWNIFFQGTNYSNKAVTKNQLQQEANIIISKLNKIHLQSDSYNVQIESCKFSIEATINGSPRSPETFENDLFCISLKNVPNTVIPKKDNVNLELIIQQKNDPSTKLKIDTLLHRLKEDGTS